jgi:FixJ family two-component response regulator
MNNQSLIEESRIILVLLEAGKEAEAAEKIVAFDLELSRRERQVLSADVRALWDQVKIAASNMENKIYFEDVKEELNKVSFEYLTK